MCSVNGFDDLAQRMGDLYDTAAKRGFGLQTLPVVDCRTEAVNTVYLRPTGVDRTITPLVDEELLAVGTYDASGATNTINRTLMLTMEAAVERATALIRQSPDVKCIVPVNGAALHDKDTATQFTNYCRSYARHLSQTLIFEVVCISGSNAMSYLDEIAIILYPFCLTYSARITPKTQDLRLYATCNYSGIALDLKDKPWPMKAVGSYFDDLVRRSEQHRLKAYCHGLGSPELADAARQAGVRYLSGSGVNALFGLMAA